MEKLTKIKLETKNAYIKKANEKKSYKGNQNIPKNNMRINRSGRGN